jgi:hypothetical protein
MSSSVTFDSSLIAPCGINCGTCSALMDLFLLWINSFWTQELLPDL